MGAVVGIDLGTTNTVVAAARDGQPVALPDESGSKLIPSIVSFLPSGAVLVGNAAKERRSQDAQNTIYSVKRLIGRTWDTEEVQQARSRLPFEMREGPGRATFVIARGETYTLPEISAFVLRKAKSIAELELGETVDRAVITVPANFNDLQRAATKVAGRVAGLEVLRILNEPTAAALAFGHTRGNRERIAVYDFGGGTFDLTLLLLTDDVFEVLSTAGDTFLGGDDIDALIVDRMLDHLGPLHGTEVRNQPERLERLRASAEQLKHALSDASMARIRLEDHEIGTPGSFEFAMSRDDLAEIVAPIAERTFGVCREALSLASLAPKDIDHVLLVGGTTRVPIVRQKVEEYFGKRARADLDPHEVVALGAARQAMALTQVRATTSGVPVAPPKVRSPAAGANDDLPARAERAAVTAAADRSKTEPFGDLRKRTDAGVGTGDDTGQAGRVSVVPPEGPVTSPAPITRNLGSRDRRTTGVGLGPTPDVLPLVGQVPTSKEHEQLEMSRAPSTLDGLGPKSASAQGPGGSSRAEPADLPLPLVGSGLQGDTAAAGTRRGKAMGPTVRVTRGTAAPTDLTATLASAHAATTAAKGTPDDLPAIAKATAGRKSPRETIPDEVGAWGEPSMEPAELGLPIVKASPAKSPEATAHKAKTIATSSDPIADLPLVGALPSPPTHVDAPKSSTESAKLPLLGLPDPSWDDEADDNSSDEPTVVRRALSSEHELSTTEADPALGSEWDLPAQDGHEILDFELPRAPGAEPTLDLPALSDRAPATAAPSTPGQARKPSSLNEAEIRARYGDLPLIVGGKRVGGHVLEPSAETLTRSPSRTPIAPGGEPNRETPNAAEPPKVSAALLPRITTEVSPVAPTTRARGAADTVTQNSNQTSGRVDSAHKAPAAPASPLPAAPAAPSPAAAQPSSPSRLGTQAKTPVYSLNPQDLEPLEFETEPVEPASFELKREEVDYQLVPSSRPGSLARGTVSSQPDAEENVPRSQRLHSTRPSARQDTAVELELPIPDVPPSRQVLPSSPEGAARPHAPASPRISTSGTEFPLGPLPSPKPAAAAGREPNRSATAFNATLPLGTAAVAASPANPTIPQFAAEAPPATPIRTKAVEVPSLLGSVPKSQPARPALLIDVTPLSLCVETVGGYVDVLIARNTPVPCERTRDFVTAQDDQQVVIVRVAQGESKQFHENVFLGEVQLTGLRPAPRGQSRIAVTFGIDSDGILHVRALDVGTGISAVADLRLTGAPTSPEVAQMVARQATKIQA